MLICCLVSIISGWVFNKYYNVLIYYGIGLLQCYRCLLHTAAIFLLTSIFIGKVICCHHSANLTLCTQGRISCTGDGCKLSTNMATLLAWLSLSGY